MARNRKQNNDSNADNSELQPQLEAIAPVDEAVAGGVDRLMEVIERSVEKIGSDDAERELLRQGVTTVVQDTLLELLRPQDANMESMRMGMVAPIDENLSMGTGEIGQVTDTAVDAAVRGSQQVGMAFVDFTQGLITGTFNSIIKATIDQMKAYTDMVADLTKSLKEFASENVSEETINEKLAQLTFEEKVGTATTSTVFNIAATKSQRAYHLKRLYYMAPVTGGHRANILKLFGFDSTTYFDGDRIKEDAVTAELAKDDPLAIDTSTRVYDASQITTIRDAIKHGLARDGMNQLRQMAREGMARIVITEGEINTKLIFQVSSKETTTKTTADRKSTSYGASVSAGASWGWGNASVSGYYNNLSVSTVDQTSVGNIETLTQMSGQVILKFKTDYKPLNDGTGSVKESDLAPIV